MSINGFQTYRSMIGRLWCK